MRLEYFLDFLHDLRVTQRGYSQFPLWRENAIAIKTETLYRLGIRSINQRQRMNGDTDRALHSTGRSLAAVKKFNLGLERLGAEFFDVLITDPDPSPLIQLELLNRGVQRFLCLDSIAARFIYCPLSRIGSSNHFSPLKNGNESIDTSGNEGSPSSYHHPYLKSMLAILVGLSVSFYVFWNVEFGLYYERWQLWLLSLVFSLGCIAYGVDLLLEIAVKGG